MLPILRSSPGLMITLALLLGGLVVSVLVGVVVARNGGSLRPVYWFAGFFLLIVLPQLVGHGWFARGAWIREAPRRAALEQLAAEASPEVMEAAVKRLFGADADVRMVTDVRTSLGDALESADLARFAVFPSGESVLLARFKGSMAAEKGWVRYLRQTGYSQLAGTGDSQRGYVVSRPGGDRAYVLHLGNLVGAWTGPDDATIRRRMAAGGFAIPKRAPLAAVDGGDASRDPTVSKVAAQADGSALRWWIPALAVYLLLVVAYFFKGTAWAGTQRAKPGVTRISASELEARLEAVGTAETPFRVERGSRSGEWFATWRFADAKWVDLARARGMRRTFRIRMRLDESRGEVRATDYVTTWEGSVGRGGADFEWKATTGIVFAQYEHRRVIGFQWDEKGGFKPDLSYAYTFHLHEMKSPLVETVTAAGWHWRPTVWEGPRWLRWLTE